MVFLVFDLGDCVFVFFDIYFGMKILLNFYFEWWGFEVESVDMLLFDEVECVLERFVWLFWFEMLSNLCIVVIDFYYVVVMVKW